MKLECTCKASVCNRAVAASERLLETPLLTPDVEKCICTSNYCFYIVKKKVFVFNKRKYLYLYA